MTMQHAPLAPSAASRWIPCPGSIAASRDAPSERPSSFADAGTRAHAVFAECLVTGAAVADLLEDTSMQLPLQSAVNWARNIIGRRPVLIEQRLSPLPGLLDIWGTTDVCIFNPAQLAEGIIDLKYGVGVPVEAHAIQLAIYAALAGCHFGVSSHGITVWIIQPRCPHPAGPVRSYTYTPEDLARIGQELRLAAAATRQPNALRRAGRWCRFCPARPVCEELRRTPGAIPPIASQGPPILGVEPW
jgi:hypothetical protein